MLLNKIVSFLKTQDGIGQLKVMDGGVQLEGQAVILDELRTSHLRSRQGQPMTFGTISERITKRHKVLIFYLQSRPKT